MTEAESIRMQSPLYRVPVCGVRTGLPADLIPIVMSFANPGSVGIADIELALRCTLGAHATGDHHAFVMHLDGPDTGSVWTRWTGDQPPATAVVLPDCDATSASAEGREPCCEFAGHFGAHTYDIADPARAR